MRLINADTNPPDWSGGSLRSLFVILWLSGLRLTY